ncbi:MAG: hypothetical protein IJ545_04655 [Alphaproteobacteria bacterium]|nr:hypothetical protein [Alphaproteobacteria bacterium]
MPKTNLDEAVLSIIRGNLEGIKESVNRLYQSGDITDAELASCVNRLIDLSDYNEIIDSR